MGVVQNIIGLVRDIHDRQRMSKVDDQLKNYLNNPNETINAIQQIDPRFGIALNQQHTSEDAARLAASQAQQDRALGTMRSFLRGLPEGADTDAAFQQMAPFMQQLGVPEGMYGGFQSAVKANPNALLDDKAYEAMMKDRFTGTVVTPGSIYMRGGKEVTRAPYAMKAETTPQGATTTVFDPNKGEFVAGGGAGPAPVGGGAGAIDPSRLTVDSLRPLFVAQESSGNYKARNPETGALGRYQIMPDTGRALAAKVGVAWNPAMMTRDDPASRRYQDALGNAAIQESIDYGQGDPMKIFGHYYGGNDTRRWGPKTRRYQQDMMGRLGAGGGGDGGQLPNGATVSSTTVTGAPKPPPKSAATVRPLSPEEVAQRGFAPGTVAQVDSNGKVTVLDKVPAAARPKPYDANRAQDFMTTMDRTRSLVNSLLQNPGLDSAVGSFQGRMPGWMLGQQGQNFSNDLETLTRQIGLNELMRFKQQSSQGASGFGNLSNEEGKRLESAWGTLNRTSDEKVMRSSLRQILSIIDASTQRTRTQMDAYDRGENPNAPPAPGQRGGGASAAPVGTIVKVGNGQQIKTANGWEPYNGR